MHTNNASERPRITKLMIENDIEEAIENLHRLYKEAENKMTLTKADEERCARAKYVHEAGIAAAEARGHRIGMNYIQQAIKHLEGDDGPARIKGRDYWASLQEAIDEDYSQDARVYENLLLTGRYDEAFTKEIELAYNEARGIWVMRILWAMDSHAE